MISTELLRRYPYFAGVGEEHLRAIATVSEERDIAADDVLFGEGEVAQNLFIVKEGEVDIMFELNNGQQRAVDTAVAGDLLCWSAVVVPHRTTATAKARIDSKLIAIEGARLRGLCEEDPILGYRLMHEVSQLLSHRLHGSYVQLAAAG